ncbi:MAG: hypothetical protein AVDCRST_MAG51-1868 [uncultured Ramlibacter sp.]|uniref:Lipoprotein n=1 Tax=uncultured Ramlibacter sp. TaxID=260755 RepID=A0A6J4PKN7_9BURK|nr:MAG: hypothetical protein AVDCRST_MAG51-1868 [uncultured Ramlibacter sp.]
MPVASVVKVWIPALLALTALASSCDPTRLGMALDAAPGESPQEVALALQGTWLREYEQDGVRARRVLTLGPNHLFRESVRAVDARGAVLEQEHEGNWFYDGTNLKRKYTSMDGKPPSRLRPPFVTVQIAFESRNAFLGTDNLRGHQVRYRRVPPETRP